MSRAFTIEVEGVNQNKIYSVAREVLRGGGVTRYELADATGMSGVTVGKIVSEMLRHSLFVTEEQFSSHRRAPEKIFPSERINILVFRFTKHQLSAILCDPCKRVLFSSARPLNESLPFEFDISAFADSVMQSIAAEINHRIVGVAVIAEREQIKLIQYAQSEIFSEADIFSTDDCIADYVRREYPSGCVAHISLDHTMSVNIFSEGKPVNSGAEHSIPLDAVGEESAIRFAAEFLSPLFRILSPSRLLIDSDILGVTPEFARELYSKIKRAGQIKDEKMPDITVCDELSFDTLSAIGQMCDKLAGIFAGI